MGLFDSSMFSDSAPGWLSALLSDPALLGYRAGQDANQPGPQNADQPGFSPGALPVPLTNGSFPPAPGSYDEQAMMAEADARAAGKFARDNRGVNRPFVYGAQPVQFPNGIAGILGVGQPPAVDPGQMPPAAAAAASQAAPPMRDPFVDGAQPVPFANGIGGIVGLGQPRAASQATPPMQGPSPLPPSAFSPSMTQNAPSDTGFQYGPGGRRAWQNYAQNNPAQLPANSTPTQGQLEPQQEQPNVDVLDRLAAGANNLTTGGNLLAGFINSLQGLSTGKRTDPAGMAQQNQTATASAIYKSLIQAGQYSPAQAHAIAVAASTNPAIAQAILPQALGPKQAPTTVNWESSDGIKKTAYWDPKTQQYLDVETNRPVPSLARSASNATSPYTASPVPPGVDPAKFRADEAARIADANKELRTKAEGSIDFLPDAIRVMDSIKGGKYEHAIGPIEGSPAYNEYVRGYGGALDPTGTARGNLGKYNELNADIKRLASKNLKAQFGGRITNVEIGQNNQTFGGAQSADSQTAHNILSERTRAAYETLQRAVEAQLVDPRSIPPEVIQRGVDMGALEAKTFGVKPSSEWTTISPGIRIREKK